MLALVTASMAIARDTDLPLLRAELPEARVEVWDDPEVDWSTFGAVIVRSVWDYHERRGEFLEWARRVEARTSLWNPVDLLIWNTDKRYLLDLVERGIPVVPTRFVAGADPVGDLAGDIVIKPTVGASASGADRFVDDAAMARAHIKLLHTLDQVAMIQPYMCDVDEHGETGLVYLRGQFSHAFRKGAILATRGVVASTDPDSEDVGPRVADAAELALGDRVMAAVGDTAYARIDLVPSDDGPVVLEVEVTEPSLYLHCDPGATARAAEAFRSLMP